MALTLVALALLIAAAWASGAAVLAGLPSPELRRVERASLEITAGLGIVAAALSAALLTHVFSYAAILLVVVAAIGAVVARARRRVSHAAAPPRGRFASSRTALVIAGCGIAACAGAVAPITDHDALSYIVPIARHIADEGALRVWSDQAPSMWPQGHTVLLAFIVRSGGDRLGALSALEWLLALGAMSAFARRACARAGDAPLAVALVIASPAAAFQVSAGKEDMLLLAATAGALFCLTGPKTDGDAAAAGIFAGVAAGAKYPGLGVALAVVAWIAIAWPGGRRARAAMAAASCAAAIGGGWYALNLVRFGNPVAPFVFGVPGTPLDAAAVRSTMDDYGAGRGFVNVFVTPARIFFDWPLYCGRAALFNPFVYVGIAALFIRRLRLRAAPLLFTAAVLYVGWYETLQNARLLLPAALALAPPAADLLGPLVKKRWALATVGVGVPLLLAPVVGVIRAARYLANPATYLARETEHYGAIEWANAHLDPRRDRLLSMYGAVGYLSIPAIGLDMLHQLEFDQAALADHRSLLAQCRRRGVTHILGLRDGVPDIASELRVVYADPASPRGDARFFRTVPVESIAIFAIAPETAASR